MIHLPGRKQPREIQLLPVFLGSISRGWRQVAWSTPQLWASLSLHLSVSGVEAEKITFLLDLYLDNICGLLITLCITFGRRYHKNIGGDPIGRVFFKEENMKKFGDLSLHHPPAGWLCRFGGPFSCLVKIHLSGKCDAMQLADTAFFTNAPMLRTISIDGILGPLPRISWSLITSLRFENVPSTVALRCLLESPNLVGFHYVHMRSNSGYFADDDEGGDEEPLEIPTTLTFHHLRILEWSFKLTRTFDLFLRRIRLPVLRSLIWAQREKFLANTPPPGVWTFFQNLSSAPLTTLGLCGMFDIDTTFLTHVYHQTPRVESLVLMHCTEATLCAAMSSLSPPTEWDEEPVDGGHYLPKLKFLEFRGFVLGDPDDLDPVVEVLGNSFGGTVASMSIRRANADPQSSLCISFRFNKLTRIRWRSSTKEMLRRLIGGGASLALVEDGEQMTWLSGNP